jgi:hypothetical protein
VHRASWYSDFFSLLEDSIRAHDPGITFQRGLVDLGTLGSDDSIRAHSGGALVQ